MSEPKEIKVDEFTVGTTIFLYYKAGHGSRVHVDFCSEKERDILLHFNPRYDQKCLVLNTCKAGVWEREEKPGGFPTLVEPGTTAIESYSIKCLISVI